jgi:hypothetical protein
VEKILRLPTGPKVNELELYENCQPLFFILFSIPPPSIASIRLYETVPQMTDILDIFILSLFFFLCFFLKGFYCCVFNF